MEVQVVQAVLAPVVHYAAPHPPSTEAISVAKILLQQVIRRTAATQPSFRLPLFSAPHPRHVSAVVAMVQLGAANTATAISDSTSHRSPQLRPQR
jgi:hypothetical protein